MPFRGTRNKGSRDRTIKHKHSMLHGVKALSFYGGERGNSVASQLVTIIDVPAFLRCPHFPALMSATV